MLRFFIFIAIYLSSFRGGSQIFNDLKEQDSTFTEQLLDSALNMVYKAPLESKIQIQNNLNKHSLSYYFTSKSLNYIGIAYDVLGNNDSALLFYDSALHIANTHRLTGMQASVNNNIGLIYWKKGNYEEAIAYYDVSLKLFHETGNLLGAANTLNNMGLIYHKMKAYKMSLTSYREAHENYAKLNNQRGISAVLMNMGAIKDLTGETDSSYYYYRKAIQIKKEIQDNYGLGLAYSDFAKIFQKKNKCDSSVFYNKSALKIFQKIGNNYHLSQVIYGIGKDFICLNQLDSAEVYLKKAEKIAGSNENIYTLRNISEQLVVVYQRQQNWEKAFEASQNLKYYADSLYSKDKAEAIFDVQQKYETEKTQRELAEKKADLAKQNERLIRSKLDSSRKSFWLLIALVSIVGVIIFTIILVKQSKTKRKKLLHEKELKSKEEKLRISKELHDNIGARLSHIISSLDIEIYTNRASAEISNVSSFARETMRELRETIWAVGDKSVYFSELKQRIENYLNQINTISAVSIHFSDKTTVNFELTAIETINIFRIIQEAVNNALKYSNTKNVFVSLEEEGKQIQFKIEDEGVGFNEDEALKMGNGLKNMKNRASELGGELHFSSSPKGTTVLFTMDVK